MLITHDMGVVAQACDRVVVLYAGRVAEAGTVEDMFEAPRHPYTRALIGCIPREAGARQPEGHTGRVPSVVDYPQAAAFIRAARAPKRFAARRCRRLTLEDGSGVACHFLARRGCGMTVSSRTISSKSGV